MAEQHWIKIKIVGANLPLMVASLTHSGDGCGKFHTGNRREVNARHFEYQPFPPKQEFIIHSCGLQMETNGTTGSFQLYDAETNESVCGFKWDCPYKTQIQTKKKKIWKITLPGFNLGPGKSNSWSCNVTNQEVFDVQMTGGSTADDEIGEITLKVRRRKKIAPPKRDATQLLDTTIQFDAHGHVAAGSQAEMGRALYLIRSGAKAGRVQHVLILIHGVDDNAGSYTGFVDPFNDMVLRPDPRVARIGSPPADYSNTAVLRVQWASQNMARMLADLGRPMVVMNATMLARGGLQGLVTSLAYDLKDRIVFHLVGHSMGCRVIADLLPEVHKVADIRTVFLMQGFASQAMLKDAKAHLSGRLVVTRSIHDGQTIHAVNYRSTVLGTFGLPKAWSHWEPIGPAFTAYDFGRHKLVTLDGDGWISGHTDVKHEAMAWAFACAAGFVRSALPAEPRVPQGRRWMAALNQESKGAFFRQPLRSVCLPASHDAGAARPDCSHPGITGLVETQSLTIGEQLRAGIRFFDIRPFLPKNDKTGANFACGHYDNAPVLGWSGGLGQRVDSLLDEVNAFCAQNPDELVLLLFSHFGTTAGSGLPLSLQRKLIELVKGKLGTRLFKCQAGEQIHNWSIENLLKAGQVICLFETTDQTGGKSEDVFKSLADPASGIIPYANISHDHPKATGTNLGVFDKYSNSYALFNVVQDQRDWKFVNEYNATDDQRQFRKNGLFLLSHTATMNDWRAITGATTVGQNIRWHARHLKRGLFPVVMSLFRKHCRKPYDRIPNLLYVDDVQARNEPALTAAVAVNLEVLAGGK